MKAKKGAYIISGRSPSIITMSPYLSHGGQKCALLLRRKLSDGRRKLCCTASHETDWQEAGYTDGMAKKAGSRILGHIARNSRVWEKALEHIALHFKPMAGKAAHVIFEPKFRNMKAIEELVTKAMTKLGWKPVVTQLTDAAGVAVGKPAVILEKEFAEVIGRKGATECKILRVIVDFTGRPITAYPVDKFFAGATLAVAISAAASKAEASKCRALSRRSMRKRPKPPRRGSTGRVATASSTTSSTSSWTLRALALIRKR